MRLKYRNNSDRESWPVVGIKLIAYFSIVASYLYLLYHITQ